MSKPLTMKEFRAMVRRGEITEALMRVEFGWSSGWDGKRFRFTVESGRYKGQSGDGPTLDEAVLKAVSRYHWRAP